MKLHQLVSVDAVVKHGLNLTRAAASLNASQPALTMHIQLLEAELRTPLFIRQRNRFVGSPDLRETKPGQSYSARFHLAFSDESDPRKAWSRGESALELGIEIIRGVPLIVSIHEKAVRREKGTLPAR